MNKNKFYFTVVICTYNRKNILKKSLKSLILQSFNKHNYEIFIMDDGSTDGTPEMVNKIVEKTKIPEIRLIRSNNIGLAHCRNIAASKSRSEFIAFLDDDAIADKNWLDNIYNNITFLSDPIIAITGPILPFYLTPKPYWFKDYYETIQLGETARFLKYGETMSGANMTIARSAIQKYKGFEEKIDMKGDLLLVGEETKFFERIWEKNSKLKLLYYSPDVIVHHLIHPYKMKVLYRLKRQFASGQSYYLRNNEDTDFQKLIKLIKVTGYLIISLILAPVLSWSYPDNKSWMVERIGPLFFAAGYFFSLMNISLIMKSSDRI